MSDVKRAQTTHHLILRIKFVIQSKNNQIVYSSIKKASRKSQILIRREIQQKL